MEIQEQTLVQIGQEQTLTVPGTCAPHCGGACGENDTLEQLTIPANHTQLCAAKLFARLPARSSAWKSWARWRTQTASGFRDRRRCGTTLVCANTYS